MECNARQRWIQKGTHVSKVLDFVGKVLKKVVEFIDNLVVRCEIAEGH